MDTPSADSPISERNDVEGRTFPEVTISLVSKASDDAHMGIKRLLAAAIEQNPDNPELGVLYAEWANLVFDTATPCPYPGMHGFEESDAQNERSFGRMDCSAFWHLK